MRRRDFLRIGGGLGFGVVLGPSVWDQALAAGTGQPAQGGPGPYGPLQAADANGIMLPQGFQSRIIAISGSQLTGTSYTWHNNPDGGATFETPDGGWIYVSNAENDNGQGAGAVRFDSDANVTDAYQILTGTSFNCAGGATPWDTWLSCEEFNLGLVWECDPYGVVGQIARSALGTFQHEAVVADPILQRLYLTEDQGDGCFYRFTPDVWGDLSSGLLEFAEVDGLGVVSWHEVPNPNPNGGQTPTCYQVPQATPFNRGEGMVYSKGQIYFATTGDNTVWQYDPLTDTICIRYDAAQDPSMQLTAPDNLAAASNGVIAAEDGGNMELVLLGNNGVASPLLRVTGQDSSEITGPAFDPSGWRLYFSSQTGTSGNGITYEVSGPFVQRRSGNGRC